MAKSRGRNTKNRKALTSQLGKGNSAQFHAEKVRAEQLKAKLDRGEDLSPEDEAWLLKLDPSGNGLNNIKEVIEPYATLNMNADGKVQEYENFDTGYKGEASKDSGDGMVELRPTKRMTMHTDIVDENGKEIVSEGPNMTPLNGHSIHDALLANEMRNAIRLGGDFPDDLSKQMTARKWQTKIPISSSDMRTMEAARKLRKYREQATLADEIHDKKDSTISLKHPIANRVRQGLFNAHRFVLTSEAAEKVGEAIRSYPDMLALNGKFALAPFQNTWIEMPTSSLFRGLGLQYEGEDSPATDNKIGYLILDDKVYVAANTDDESAIFLPIEYTLHQPMHPNDEKDFCDFFECTRLQIDQFMWGEAFVDRVENPRALRASHSARVVNAYLADMAIRGIDKGQHWQQLLRGAAGDLRNVLGILLMMNQPAKYLRTYETKQKRSLSSKGPKLFMSHSTVELTLSRKPIRQLLTRNKEAGHHSSPRWHEVRGHFCQDKQAREGGCDHGGGELWCEYEPKKWECLECGGKRWWREYPEGRGDSTLGVVKNQHRVRA